MEPIYEVRPRRDKRGFDLISDAMPFGRLWFTKPDDAVDYAKHFSRSHDAIIRVYGDAGNVIGYIKNRTDELDHAVNWEAISAIGQIVGAFAVVISLILKSARFAWTLLVF